MLPGAQGDLPVVLCMPAALRAGHAGCTASLLRGAQLGAPPQGRAGRGQSRPPQHTEHPVASPGLGDMETEQDTAGPRLWEAALFCFTLCAIPGNEQLEGPLGPACWEAAHPPALRVAPRPRGPTAPQLPGPESRSSSSNRPETRRDAHAAGSRSSPGPASRQLRLPPRTVLANPGAAAVAPVHGAGELGGDGSRPRAGRWRAQGWRARAWRLSSSIPSSTH